MTRSRALPLIVLLAAACGRDRSQVSTLSAATLPPAGIGDSAVRLRRLEVDSGRFMPWAPSADGRFMSGLDQKTGNVAVREMRTGEIRLLTKAADWGTSSREAEAPLMSPNGRMVVYAWQNDAPTFDYELRVVGVDGSGERVLLKPNAAIVEEFPVDWTPDSRGVLALLYGRDNSTRLALVNVADGTVRVIRSFDWRSPEVAKISPDGTWIAYDFQVDERSDAREIVLVRPGDGRESRVTNDGVPKSFVGWSPAGDGLFYRTTRGDATSIWFVPMRDGRTTGPARLVRADLWGAQVLGTARGALYYSVTDVRQAIYNVPVDLDAGRTTAPPTVMVTGTFMRGPAEWAPDGRHVAFVRVLDAQRFAVIIRDAVSGEERVLPLRLQYGDVTRWSADGRSILIRARQRNQFGNYRVDLATGTADLVSKLESSGDRSDFSADGKTEYRMSSLHAGPFESPLDSSVLVVRDLASGAEREIYRGRQISGPRLSPNESTVAFVRAVVDTTPGCCPPGSPAKGVQLLVMPTSGGEPRALFTGAIGQVGPRSPNWTADGQSVLFAGFERLEGATTFHLSVVDVGTRHVRKLLSQKEQTGGARLSPDGRQVTFWNTVGGKTSELWAMENLPGGPRQ